MHVYGLTVNRRKCSLTSRKKSCYGLVIFGIVLISNGINPVDQLMHMQILNTPA